MDDYEYLRMQFPAQISLNQMTKLCKISRRSAIYLLKHKIVPCKKKKIDKYWSYKIDREDAIYYLKQRTIKGSMIPRGAVNNKPSKRPTKPKRPTIVGTHQEIKRYFTHLLSESPDVLSVQETARATGLCQATILSFIKQGRLDVLDDYSRHWVPKPYLIRFMLSNTYLNSKSGANAYKRVIGGFEIWKAAKS